MSKGTEKDLFFVPFTLYVVWELWPGGAAYVVDAALSPAGVPVASVPVNGTSLVVPQVPPGVYYVRVRATNTEAVTSNEVLVTVAGSGSGCGDAPNQPLNLTASSAGNLVSLAWNAPTFIACTGCSAHLPLVDHVGHISVH